MHWELKLKLKLVRGYRRRLSTLDLLIKVTCLVTRYIILLLLKISWAKLAQKVNRTEPSPSARIPCPNTASIFWGCHAANRVVEWAGSVVFVLCTVDLLVLTSLDQLNLYLTYYLPFHETSYTFEKVNRTGPSPLLCAPRYFMDSLHLRISRTISH